MLQTLFCIVDDDLHWKIGTTHTAPTGEWVNVHGVVYRKTKLLLDLYKELSPTSIKNIDVRPSGKLRVRRTTSGRRLTVGEFSSFSEAINACQKQAA